MLDGHVAGSAVGPDTIFDEVEHVVFGNGDAANGFGPLHFVVEFFRKVSFVGFLVEVIAGADLPFHFTMSHRDLVAALHKDGVAE